jgi:hypothetical protein
MAVPLLIEDRTVVPNVVEHTFRDDEPVQHRGHAGVTVRRRPTPTPVILPPVALPMTAQRRERTVAALSQLFTAWWQQRGEMVDNREAPR